MPHECRQGESKQTRARSSQGQAASASGSEFLISQRISGNRLAKGVTAKFPYFLMTELTVSFALRTM